MKQPDGSEKTYSYSVYITERNEVESVPNVVKLPEDEPEEAPIREPDGGGTLI